MQWYNWTIVLPAELAAAAVLVGFWTQSVNVRLRVIGSAEPAERRLDHHLPDRRLPDQPRWRQVLRRGRVLVRLDQGHHDCRPDQCVGAQSTVSDSAVLGIIIAAAPRFAPQPPSPYAPSGFGGSIGFYYWRNPGPLVQFDGVAGSLGRFLGFFSVLIQAAFSYIGTEITVSLLGSQSLIRQAIAAGEAKNPKRNMPKAIKRVYARILLFYLGGTFIIGMLVPSNHPDLRLGSTAAKSPFVIVRSRSDRPSDRSGDPQRRHPRPPQHH